MGEGDARSPNTGCGGPKKPAGSGKVTLNTAAMALTEPDLLENHVRFSAEEGRIGGTALTASCAAFIEASSLLTRFSPGLPAMR